MDYYRLRLERALPKVRRNMNREMETELDEVVNNVIDKHHPDPLDAYNALQALSTKVLLTSRNKEVGGQYESKLRKPAG